MKITRSQEERASKAIVILMAIIATAALIWRSFIG